MLNAVPVPSWTLLSSHGQVLVCLARDPQVRLREVAAAVGVTERAVQKIVGDLAAAGIVTRHRVGRRNRYHLDPARDLAVPAGPSRALGSVLAALLPAP
jgi:DNA-binding Lrp family transcriptional regulator